MKLLSTTFLATLIATGAMAQNDCAAGRTLADGKLTVATGNPAYFPWVIDDAPESKQGFEAAVAYAVAGRMGFGDDQVVWVRSSFDQATSSRQAVTARGQVLHLPSNGFCIARLAVSGGVRATPGIRHSIPAARRFSASILLASTRMAALEMLAVVRLQRRTSALPSTPSQSC